MTLINQSLEVAIVSNDPGGRQQFFKNLYMAMAEEILLRAYAYFKHSPNTELLAEESLQNTFEKLMKKNLVSFGKIADIKAYVLKVAYSQFANVHQHRKNKSTVALVEQLGIDDHSSYCSSIEINHDLKKALSETLNDRQRTVICLWLEGYSYKEIAKQVESSETSVRGLVFRARKNIRNYLEGYGWRPQRA